MTTALHPFKNQSIRRSTLAALLADDGLAYEALGAGVKASLDCLAHSREFYALPEALSPHLDDFALHLHQALAALERARAVGLS